jgi:hypothetical protein
MANDATIQLVITSDGSIAIRSMQGVQDQMRKMESESSGAMTTMKGHWLAISAAAVGALAAIEKAWEMAEAAAAYQEQRDTLNRLVAQYDTTAGEIVRRIKEVTDNHVSMADAVDIAANSMGKALSPDQLIKLAEAAETFSNRSGKPVVEIFRQMAEALSTGRARSLQLATGIIDLESKYGKQLDTMNKAQQAQLLYNEVIERATQVKKGLGDQAQSTSDRMESFTIMLKDWALTAGNVAMRSGLALWGLIQLLGAAALGAAGAFATFMQGVTWLTDKLNLFGGNNQAYWAKMATDLDASMQKMTDSAVKDLDAAFKTTESSAKVMNTTWYEGMEGSRKATDKAIESLKRFQAEVMALNPNSDETAKKIEKLTESARKLEDEIGSAYASKIRELLSMGIGFIREDELNQLSAQYREWQAELATINQTVQDRMTEKTMTELAKRLYAEEKWAADLGVLLGKLGLDAEEFESRWNEIVAVREEEKYRIRMEWLQKYFDSAAKARDMQDQINKSVIMDGMSGSAASESMGSLLDMAQGKDKYASQLEAQRQAMWERIAVIQEMDEYELQLFYDTESRKAAIEQEFADYRIQQEAVVQQQRVAMTSASLGMLAGSMMDLYKVTGQQSAAMFAMYKSFAIAQTMIDTYKAAQGAYAAMAGIPVVGPALAVAAATAAIVAGMARVAAIASMSPGNVSASTGGSGGYVVTPASSLTSPGSSTATETRSRPQEINIHIYGNIVDQDKFARETLPAIRKALTDGA